MLLIKKLFYMEGFMKSKGWFHFLCHFNCSILIRFDTKLYYRQQSGSPRRDTGDCDND